jgi:uncharacterized damage-inducible protein DinB
MTSVPDEMSNEHNSKNDLKAQMERVAFELAEGRGAHVDPVGCIEDLRADTACRKPAGFEHSICEIVAHLNYWMEYDMKRMRGTPDPYPAHAAESWTSSENVREADWRKIVGRFRELLYELESVCRSDASAWMKQAPAAHPSHEKNASTVGAMIFQLIAHNSYHIGQIVDLRRALGAWPPAKGGDTW